MQFALCRSSSLPDLKFLLISTPFLIFVSPATQIADTTTTHIVSSYAEYPSPTRNTLLQLWFAVCLYLRKPLRRKATIASGSLLHINKYCSTQAMRLSYIVTQDVLVMY